MKISIFGMGYVGTVSAGCLAQDGHEVIGVDPVRTKVDLINAGQSPIIEVDIGEIIAATVKSGRLRATDDQDEAIPRNGTVVRLRRDAEPGQRQSGFDLHPARLRIDRQGAQK